MEDVSLSQIPLRPAGGGDLCTVAGGGDFFAGGGDFFTGGGDLTTFVCGDFWGEGEGWGLVGWATHSCKYDRYYVREESMSV